MTLESVHESEKWSGSEPTCVAHNQTEPAGTDTFVTLVIVFKVMTLESVHESEKWSGSEPTCVAHNQTEPAGTDLTTEQLLDQ